MVARVNRIQDSDWKCENGCTSKELGYQCNKLFRDRQSSDYITDAVPQVNQLIFAVKTRVQLEATVAYALAMGAELAPIAVESIAFTLGTRGFLLAASFSRVMYVAVLHFYCSHFSKFFMLSFCVTFDAHVVILIGFFATDAVHVDIRQFPFAMSAIEVIRISVIMSTKYKAQSKTA